jgi:tetratricopeptide (TPR) repeat protein
MTLARPDPRQLWTGDLADMAKTVAEVITELGRSPQTSGFEWLLSVAEDAMEVGLSEVSAQLLDACTTLLPRLAGDTERAAIAARLANVGGLLALRTGRIADAERLLRTAAQASQDVGDVLGEALAQQNLAAALWLSGNMAAAREYATAALDIYTRTADPVRRAQMLINLANYDLDEESIDEAEARLNEAATLARGPAATSVRTSILGTRALVARARGDQQLAGTIHRQVLRRARRNGNIHQARIAMQDLGNWYAETGQPRRAASWIARAAELGKREGNTILSAQLLRAQAVQLFAAGRIGQSISVVRSALELSDQVHDEQGGAEGCADLAAFLIHASQSGATDRDADGLVSLDEAGALLETSLAYFQQTGDTPWIQRVLANFASLALAQGRPLQALERLVTARESLETSAAAARINIDRRAASIAIGDAHRPELAAEFIRNAALEIASAPAPVSIAAVPEPPGAHPQRRGAAAAWELALGAAQLRDYPFALQQAIELFAEARATATQDDALLFHITNDLGSSYDQGDDPESAIECFDACLDIAGRLDDRVMRQQALANRAEMARRRREPGAIERFREAIRLAEDLADTPAQVASLLNLASAYVDEDRSAEAEEAVLQAEERLDRTEGLDDVNGRLLTIKGNIAWALEDFDAARVFYLAAAEQSEGAERIQSIAAGLVTLARMRQRERYRRLLERLIRVGQRAKLDGIVAEALLPSAEEWLAAEAVGLSARTYAEAIELALMQWWHDLPAVSDTTVETTAETDPAQALDSRMDPVVGVIARMTAGLARVPTLRPRVTRQTIARLQRDLPEEIQEIVITWVEQANTILADINHQTPGANYPPRPSTGR